MSEYPILMHNYHIDFEDGDQYRVMYLYKDFMFIEMSDTEASYLPITPLKRKSILREEKGRHEYSKSEKVIEMLNNMIEGLDAAEEYQKIYGTLS